MRRFEKIGSKFQKRTFSPIHREFILRIKRKKCVTSEAFYQHIVSNAVLDLILPTY